VGPREEKAFSVSWMLFLSYLKLALPIAIGTVGAWFDSKWDHKESQKNSSGFFSL
jgi:hypothetical protein